MRLRQATVTASLLIAGCGSGPRLSPDQTRRVVTAALESCDSATHVLTVNLGHASRVGVYQMAGEVEAQCSGATLDLMKANLPDNVGEPCRGASEAARLAGSMAKDASETSPNPAELTRLGAAMGAASAQRQECDSALAHLT